MSNKNLVDLGVQVGRFLPSKEFPRLAILQEASQEDGYYIPAASIVIWGEPSLKALRDFLILKFPIEPTERMEGG